jgi:hypothetical protein
MAMECEGRNGIGGGIPVRRKTLEPRMNTAQKKVYTGGGKKQRRRWPTGLRGGDVEILSSILVGCFQDDSA